MCIASKSECNRFQLHLRADGRYLARCCDCGEARILEVFKWRRYDEDAEEKVAEYDKIIPLWTKANPVVRIAEVEIREVPHE